MTTPAQRRASLGDGYPSAVASASSSASAAAALLLPVTIAVASEVASEGDLAAELAIEAREQGNPTETSGGVPASECPEAVADLRAAGIDVSESERFYPDCSAAERLLDRVGRN